MLTLNFLMKNYINSEALDLLSHRDEKVRFMAKVLILLWDKYEDSHSV